MPIDTSIYQQALRPGPSVQDGLNTLNQQDMNQLQLASGQQQFAEAKAVANEKNALRAALGSGQVDLSTPQGRSQLYAVAPTLAPGVLKTMQDQMTAQALASKDTAQAGNFKSDSAATDYKTAVAKSDKAILDISNLTDPQAALASLQAHHSAGDIDDQKYQSVLSTLAPSLQDPNQFGGWKRNMVLGILDAKDKIAATAPKITMQNTGGSIVPVNENADAGTVGPVAGAAPMKVSVSPNTSATINAENERARLGRQTQLQVAGMDANGNYNLPTIAPAAGAPAAPGAPGAPAAAAKGPTSALQGLVDGLGSYQIPESTAFSRMTAPAKAAVLQAVKTQYPDYDPTVYTERNASSRAFAPNGKNGQAVKSFNVGLAHLDALSQLGDQLGNGSIPVLNSVGNYIAQQTGGSAQTNFAAAKNIVTDEVVKAIVGGGGGVGDRDKAASTINAAETPKQLQEAIATVKTLMGGQLVGLEQSYKAGTGRNDFRTKYLSPEAQKAIQALTQTAPGAAPAPAAPTFDTNAIAAELQRRATAGGH